MSGKLFFYLPVDRVEERAHTLWTLDRARVRFATLREECNMFLENSHYCRSRVALT